MIRFVPLLAALAITAAAPAAFSQERPPIAMPGPSIAPSAPTPSTTPSPITADILALSVAVEAAGCRLDTANSASVLAASGLNPMQAELAKNTMLRMGMATPIDGGMAMDTCATVEEVDPVTIEVVPAPEPEPLTLFQRRRCADNPRLAFCG